MVSTLVIDTFFVQCNVCVFITSELLFIDYITNKRMFAVYTIEWFWFTMRDVSFIIILVSHGNMSGSS